eukprot:TRINITY_DN1277_c0_g1_i1.p1 TRINITY_DN1277_c0_g1~~TRINITY_DN1277_c0_g1_i1.p1  ORF type:complete len:550 (+),score=220.82 TRINITY_DN1277_c0_g1_i1:95-1744(+)
MAAPGGSAFDKEGRKAARGVDLEQRAGCRREAAVSLRQKKKDEILREKRGRMEDKPSAMDAAHTDPMADMGPVPGPQGDMTQGELADLASKLHVPDPAVVLPAVHVIRKMLSREHNPPIDGVIQAGCVPQLVKLLECHDTPGIQFEAAWALTNIASGTSAQCDSVIRSGACPQFVALMDSPNDDVREQAVWALGNIAGDSANCRDLVISTGALDKIINIILSGPSTSILRNATWAMSNCLRSKPPPDLQKVAQALPMATRLLASQDEAVVIDAAWALSYASDGPSDRIDAVLAQQPLPALIALMQRDQQLVATPALRTVGNIVTGSAAQTQAVIDAGALPVIKVLLNHPNKVIRKECCWFISNVSAGTKEQIQAVVDSQCMEQVIVCLSAHEFEVRKEAAWAIANLTTSGTPEQIHYLCMKNVLGPLCEQLQIPDPKIVVVALEAIENIIRAGEAIAARHACNNAYKESIQALGGVEKIEQLQDHTSDEVYSKAVSLLEEFFEGEDDGMYNEGEAPPAQADAPPIVPPQGGFQLGGQPATQPAGQPFAF